MYPIVLSEGTARQLADLLRERIRTRPQINGSLNQKRTADVHRFYRIETNATGGEYTVRRQQWNVTSHEFEDLTDSADIEYNIALTAWHIDGRDDLEGGDLVLGFIVRVNDEPVLLIADWPGLPPGTAANQMLYWPGDGVWALVDPPPSSVYMVLQLKTDGKLGWDYIRAHG